MKQHLGKIFVVAAVVAIGASIVYANYISNQANEGVVIDDHIKGNTNATVTLTEYSDFQCPACGQFFPYVNEIMDEYGDQIRFEYKHLPLISIHQFAMPAAKAAEAAGQQGAFWPMHDKLFENQQIWANSVNPVSYFTTYAEDLGLDVTTFKRHYKASVIEDAVTADFKEARELGLTGTPSFFLNGKKMDISSFQDFRDQIEEALGIVTASSTEAISTEPTVEFGVTQ